MDALLYRRPARSSRGLQAACRRVVFWAVGGYLALHLGGIVAVRLRPVLRDPDHYRRVEHLKRRKHDSPEALQVLLLGSSRSYQGINTDRLEAALGRHLCRPAVVHNWSGAGQGATRFLLAWDRLEREGAAARPDLVVVEATPLTLNVRGLSDDLRPPALRAAQLDGHDVELLRSYPERRRGLRREVEREQQASFYSQRMNLLCLGGCRTLTHPHFRIVDTPYRGRTEAIPPAQRPARVEEQRPGMLAALAPGIGRTQALWALEALLARLGKARVPTALLITPEGPTFRSYYPAGRQAEWRAHLRELAGRQKCSLIDAWDWYDSEGPFNDSHHLDIEGAKAFSERLGREAFAPLLKDLR
jgi:hypothetical protein